MQNFAYGASLRARVMGMLKAVIVMASLGLLISQAMASTATTTSLSFSPASPVGKSVSIALSATVTGSSPSGQVTFMNGSTSLGTAPVHSGV